MSTPGTPVASGFFAQLMPMLAERTVMMIVSKADEQHLTVSVIPKRLKDSENAALAMPLCCTGTPEELDRELPIQVQNFVAGHLTLSNNLAEIQREREEAEKAAREEAKRRQKTVGRGGAKAKATDTKPKEEEKPAQTAAPPMLSLFDSPEKAPQPEPREQPAASEPETTMAAATTTGGDT